MTEGRSARKFLKAYSSGSRVTTAILRPSEDIEIPCRSMRPVLEYSHSGSLESVLKKETPPSMPPAAMYFPSSDIATEPSVLDSELLQIGVLLYLPYKNSEGELLELVEQIAVINEPSAEISTDFT